MGQSVRRGIAAVDRQRPPRLDVEGRMHHFEMLERSRQTGSSTESLTVLK